jgi:hypothetical protein
VPLLSPLALNATSRAKDAVAVTESNAAATCGARLALAAGRAYLAVVAQKRVVEVSERARDNRQGPPRQRQGPPRRRHRPQPRRGPCRAGARRERDAGGGRLRRARGAPGRRSASSWPSDAPMDVVDSFDPGRGSGVVDQEIARGDDPARGREGGPQRACPRPSTPRRTAGPSTRPFFAAVGTPFYQHPASLVNPELGWQVQLVLTLPIFDGGRRRAVFREQDSVIRDAIVAARCAAPAGQRRGARGVRRCCSGRSRAPARSGARLGDAGAQVPRIGDPRVSGVARRAILEVIDAERRAAGC